MSKEANVYVITGGSGGMGVAIARLLHPILVGVIKTVDQKKLATI